MDPHYPESTTARGGIYKVTVAGPKKREPAPAAEVKPAEKKEYEYFFFEENSLTVALLLIHTPLAVCPNLFFHLL
jgi:hypothetical protein